MWHGYFGIENLNLSGEQRAALVSALRALGPAEDRSPARLNHWRTRLDGEAAIFEALWDPANITVDAFKQRLGAIFDVDPATIDHALNTVSFTETRETLIAVFSRGGTDYLRLALFGTLAGSWLDSGAETRAYIAVNLQDWEPEP